MVAEMEVNKVTEMVANMKVDMEVNKVADISCSNLVRELVTGLVNIGLILFLPESYHLTSDLLKALRVYFQIIWSVVAPNRFLYIPTGWQL